MNEIFKVLELNETKGSGKRLEKRDKPQDRKCRLLYLMCKEFVVIREKPGRHGLQGHDSHASPNKYQQQEENSMREKADRRNEEELTGGPGKKPVFQSARPDR
jgi:hypothetical protein